MYTVRHTRVFKGPDKTHRVDGVDQLARLAELHEALPQVVEGSLHQNLLLLVVVEKVVPQRLLGQGLGVAHDDNPIPTHTHIYSPFTVRVMIICESSQQKVGITPKANIEIVLQKIYFLLKTG